MQFSSPQNFGWHTYSGFDPKYFTKVREVRSLASQEQASVKVDCQLALSCRCQVQDSDAAVLILRLTTSNTGRDNVKLRAAIKLIFSNEDFAENGNGSNAENSTLAEIVSSNTLKLTSCQPAALKGLPQGARISVQSNIEPVVSAGGIVEVGLGSYTRGYEADTSMNWSFNTFCQSENEPSGYYNGVLLQLDAADRRSLQSFARRPVTSAAVLENVGGSILARSEVKLRTSAWLSRFRCWGQNKISVGKDARDKQATHRRIVLGDHATEPIESFDRLESLIRTYVKNANEESLPLEMEDKCSSVAKMAQGVPPGVVAPETKRLGDSAMDTMPVAMTSLEVTSMEQTLAFR